MRPIDEIKSPKIPKLCYLWDQFIVSLLHLLLEEAAGAVQLHPSGLLLLQHLLWLVWHHLPWPHWLCCLRGAQLLCLDGGRLLIDGGRHPLHGRLNHRLILDHSSPYTKAHWPFINASYYIRIYWFDPLTEKQGVKQETSHRVKWGHTKKNWQLKTLLCLLAKDIAYQKKPCKMKVGKGTQLIYLFHNILVLEVFQKLNDMKNKDKERVLWP